MLQVYNKLISIHKCIAWVQYLYLIVQYLYMRT